MACITLTLPDVMPDDDLTPIPIYCKTCKHWGRAVIVDWPEPDTLATIGECSIVTEVNYWDWEMAAQEKIADGKFGGANIYTNEHFGCIHYDRKF